MQIVAVTDPLTLGFRRQAMIGIKTDGDLEKVAGQLADMDEIDYVVITAGSFDVLVEVVCEDDDHLLEILGRVRAVPVRDQHRDVRVPQAPQANLLMGDQMTSFDAIEDSQEAAKRNLWLHFTRMSSYERQRRPRDRARLRGLRLRPARQALPGRAVRPVRQPGRPRPHRGRRGRGAAGGRAGLLPAVVLRAPEGHRAGRPAGRAGPRRPEPGVLHHQRLGGGRVGVEAGQAVLQADRPARPLQGDQPGHRLPRHLDGRAGHHRPGRHQAPVRAAAARRRPGAEHQLLPGAGLRGRRRGGVRPVGRGRDRAGDPARGPGVGRRGLPRAGAELRRLLPAAARLLPAGPGDLRPVRRAAGLRRGDLRVRPARLLLRLRSGTATSRTSSPSPRA